MVKGFSAFCRYLCCGKFDDTCDEVDKDGNDKSDHSQTNSTVTAGKNDFDKYEDTKNGGNFEEVPLRPSSGSNVYPEPVLAMA